MPPDKIKLVSQNEYLKLSVVPSVNDNYDIWLLACSIICIILLFLIFKKTF